MPVDGPDQNDSQFGLVHEGPAYRLAERLGLADTRPRRRMLKVALLLVVTWVPLVLLSIASGHAWGDLVKDPLLRDPDVYGRFLFALPVLELASTVVGLGLATQFRHLGERGVVPESEHIRFEEARAAAIRLRRSTAVEVAIVALSYMLALGTRLILGFSAGTSSWERIGTTITPTGWWYTLVSLPILYFFLFRWLWVFLIWGTFLFRVSRLDLQLTATHPDRTGGLGFVGWGLASFAPVLIAVSAVCAAGFADEILHRGASLDDLKYHVVVFVVAALAVLHAPLLAFSGKLSQCRFQGLLKMGALVWRHDREFDEKWLEDPQASSGETILGSSDVQSLADIATCYEHVERMWLLPFDVKAFAVLVLAALAPMIPLLGTALPLQEILEKLGELLI